VARHHRNTPSPLAHRWLVLLAIPLLLLGGVARAETWYQVELIIFEQGGEAALQEESWPENPGAPDLTQALELGAAGAEGLPYQQLSQGSLTLGALSGALSRARGYHVVWHGGWRQPARSRNSARPLHLAAGRDYGREYGTGAPLWEVEGTGTLSVSRYLHLELDLLLRKPMSVAVTAPVAADGFGEPATAMATQVRNIRLKESRRMRSSELHYFDNPLFGVLALITPLN